MPPVLRIWIAVFALWVLYVGGSVIDYLVDMINEQYFNPLKFLQYLLSGLHHNVGVNLLYKIYIYIYIYIVINPKC